MMTMMVQYLDSTDICIIIVDGALHAFYGSKKGLKLVKAPVTNTFNPVIISPRPPYAR